MADASNFYAIRKLPIDAVLWTPIVAAIYCNNFSVSCTTDMKMRTDPEDPTTEKPISAGSQEYVLSGWVWSGSRFPKNSVIAYLQAASGTPTAIVTFVC